jgi:hypothetical protein
MPDWTAFAKRNLTGIPLLRALFSFRAVSLQLSLISSQPSGHLQKSSVPALALGYRNIKKIFFLYLISLSLFLPALAQAADIEAVLDSANGTSAFTVKALGGAPMTGID